LIFTCSPTSGTGAPLAPVPISSHRSQVGTSSEHPLDRAVQSYYRRKSIEMYPSTHSRERCAVPRWRSWICFCLALFLLYNPYLAASSSTYGLNVRHPASNRATVGASELQHFSPAEGQDQLSTHATAAVEPLASFSQASSHAFALFPQVVSPSQQFFGSSLWFRPPPAL
jgi:hypothetical protein